MLSTFASDILEHGVDSMTENVCVGFEFSQNVYVGKMKFTEGQTSWGLFLV